MSISKTAEIEAFRTFIAAIGRDSYLGFLANPNVVAAIEGNIRNDLHAFDGLFRSEDEVNNLIETAQTTITKLEAEVAELKKYDIRALRAAKAAAERAACEARLASAEAAKKAEAADRALEAAMKALAT